MKDLLESESFEDAAKKHLSPVHAVFHAIRRALFMAVIFSLVLNVLQLTIPLYMMTLLDRIVGTGNKDSLYLLTIIAATALLVSAILDILRNVILNRAGSWIEAKLGVEIFPMVAMAYHDGKFERAQGLEDLWRLRSFMSSPGIISLFDVPWALFYLAVLFMLAVEIGTLALIGIVILFLIAVYNEIAVRNVLSGAMQGAENSRNLVRAVQKSTNEIVSMGMLHRVRDRWFDQNVNSLKGHYSSASRAATHLSLFKFFRMLLQLGVLFTGAMLVLDNKMTPGGIIAASIIMARALSPVEQAITAWKQALSAWGSYKRLNTMTGTDYIAKSSVKRPDAPVDLHVDSLFFQFPGTEQPFLKNVSFQVAKGEIVGLVGQSGSGKSTLAAVVAGAFRPSDGFIKLGEYEMSVFSREEIGDFIGYLPQKSEFLPGTVFENLSRFGNYTMEEVIAAATRIGAHELIMELPHGYDTEIGGDFTATLSGGQLQRLAIARTLCGNPGILVFDEPNLNLDSDADTRLATILDEEKEKGTIVIVVTHNQNLIAKCDKLVLLARGRVSKYGTRNQVLRSAVRDVGPSRMRRGKNTRAPVRVERK